MNRCLFTYEPLKATEHLYSKIGLKKLNAALKSLAVFPYTSKQLIRESQRLAGKISIQGVQPKLSVKLAVAKGVFEVVERNGTFIVKPQTGQLPELPENEDLTMHLAKIAKIKVPWHGLIACEDETRAYVIKRFDRQPRGVKIPQEDFAQLMEASRTTKYEATMEHIANVVERYCTFGRAEMPELFRRLIFSFLTGNEDMHLKNFSLLTDSRGIVKLTPAYDLLNSTIAIADPIEELALSLNDKKHGLTLDDFMLYAIDSLQLTEKLALKEIKSLLSHLDAWRKMIEISFLSDEMKASYEHVLTERARRLQT
jgi:serine/threonine-protein kinase HipA